MRHRSVLPLILALTCTVALAQEAPLGTHFLAAGITSYDADIPTPQEVIGHIVGERHTRPDQVVRYFEAVAAASDRVTFGEHGTTHQGRPLVHAIVAAPGTDLEAARRANVRLSDAPAAVTEAEMAGMPVVAYMGYSVHGDEASGTEAALLLLYHLAAGRGPAVEEVLQHAVVIIDPMLNPDGRARFVDWVNANRGGSGEFASTDPHDREHNQPWPRGRTNHYLFDLNRDWLPIEHPESRGRMALWHAWRPQLTTDFHEMGGNSTYFFQPGVPSRNNPRTPDRNFELTAELATYHARALDRMGQLYYTREDFDDFYIGKGSTYPDLQGSVGVLFEQASSRALAAKTHHGLLDYATTVRNQLATSLSSLEGAVAMRGELLRFMRDTYAGAPEFARRSRVKAWVIDASLDPALANDFVEMLGRSRVEVRALGAPLTAGGHRFEPATSFVVPVDQPQARLVKAVMERVHTFNDSLFYDVSTWTLPLAFGLPHAELEREPAVGEVIEGMPVTGRIVGGRSDVAYVIPAGRASFYRALYRLQDAGVKVRLMKDEFESAGSGWRREFERGALVVPVVNQGVDAETVHELVRRAADDGLEVLAVASGLTRGGPDLGTGSAAVLRKPRVAVVTGDAVVPNPAGEVWYLLNERAGMPVSLVDADRLGRVELGEYTAIVITDTARGGAARAFTEDEVERLRGWIQGGGTLVVSGTAADWAARSGLIELERRAAEADSLDIPFADIRSARGAQRIGGTIFEIELDTTHPIAFGHPERVAVLKQGTQAFDPGAAPGSNVARYGSEPRLSGYVSDANLERLGGGAAIVAWRSGRGAVIAFDFNPAFRAFWRGTEGLLLNALFWGREGSL